MSAWVTDSAQAGDPADQRPGRAGSWLPPDLSGWVEKETLINLVLSVVPSVDESRLRAAESLGVTLPPRVMLALLTASYAMGLYSSQAIASRADADPVVQYLCAGRQPTSVEVRRFRNRNRERIARCLETVCLVVWRIRYGACRLGLPARAGRLFGSRVRHDSLLQAEIKCEVMERLYRAEVEDSCGDEPSRVGG